MTKKFCDICKKEVQSFNKTWVFDFKAERSNDQSAYNEHIDDICETCATIIHGCVSLMRLGGIPDLKNVVSLMDSERIDDGKE